MLNADRPDLEPPSAPLKLEVVACDGATFIAKRDNPGICPGDGALLRDTHKDIFDLIRKSNDRLFERLEQLFKLSDNRLFDRIEAKLDPMHCSDDARARAAAFGAPITIAMAAAIIFALIVISRPLPREPPDDLVIAFAGMRQTRWG